MLIIQRKNIVEDRKDNSLISKKCKKTCAILSYIENLLILASLANGYVFNFSFHFFGLYPYKNYGYCNRIGNLFNNWSN